METEFFCSVTEVGRGRAKMTDWGLAEEGNREGNLETKPLYVKIPENSNLASSVRKTTESGRTKATQTLRKDT